MNRQRQEVSMELLGKPTVDMLMQAHEDALWLLENLGVGCAQPEIQEAFGRYEESGEAVLYEGRIYITGDLVRRCLSTAPGVSDFFVPLNSFFIGGTAPYVYDDDRDEGGVMPEPEHVERIAAIAEKSPVVAGMGRGVKLKDEVLQMDIMARNCSKPLYFAATGDEAIQRATKLQEARGNIMVVFCLTRPPLTVNENFSDAFVKVARAGLPLFISAMPMAGISAPYCYNGVLSMTHAEVLFGICAAQLLNPGVTVVHAGFPTIADPADEYNPNYGLMSHNLLNILMAHLNLMLDLPTIQSGGTTNEATLSEKAMEDTRNGQALLKKYGFHMIRHPFAFLRHLVDFSFAKLKAAIDIAQAVRPREAPEVPLPGYDPGSMESIRRTGLGMYMQDALTTANIGRIFNA